MITAFRDRHGIDMVQGWGMTETSPLAAVSIPPAGTPIEKQLDYRVKAGRLIFGVDVRIVDDHGATLPNDGASLGEFEISGPWITGSYFGDDDASKFHDGWLRTGDIGTLDGEGFMVISDRSKDVIKSGGEWISSVELENTVMAHPDVFEAAVVAVPDERWDERPLCCVVLNPEAKTTVEELVEWLTPRVAKWWIPERWSFVETVPKTSVGKFDKKVLRSHYADGSLNVIDRTATT
jgi:fatty-acyl-CoA synthase